ncbi:hypothetical protein Tco_0523009 [Tanacetum coccineum]
MNQEEIRQVTVRDEKWVPTKERVKIGTTIFWHTIKKVKDTNSYEFDLSNKKCAVDAEVFRKILNICLRVQREDFTEVPDDESTPTFLINLGYKVKLQEDFGFKIDHRMEKQRRCKNMSYPRIGEDFQEYGLPILETMLTEKIKQSKSYQMFIKYSTGLIPPKKSRELDVALELGKSMSLTESAEEKAVRLVHATHERIVTESDPKPAKRKPSGISFRETSSVSKKTSPDPSQKLKGVQTLTPKEKLAADTMQALKASRKSSRSQPHAGGSSKGTGTKPGVPDESTCILSTSSEETGTKPWVPDEEKGTSAAKADVILDWGSKEESEYFEEENVEEEDDWIYSDDDEDKKDNYVQEDEYVHDDKHVHNDEHVHGEDDEGMKYVEDVDIRKGDEEILDTTKADVEKTEELKDDNKKARLPLTSSSLSESFGFGNLFLAHYSDISLTETLKDTIDVEINSLLDIKIQSEVLQIQSPSILTVPVSVILELSILLPIPETTTTTSLIRKDVTELKKVDHSAEIRAIIRSQVPVMVNEYLGSSLGDVVHKVKKEQEDKQKMTKYTIKSTNKAALNEYDLKHALFQSMNDSKSFNKHPASQALYHALMEALIEDEEAMDKGVADSFKQQKRSHGDEDEDPSAGLNRCFKELTDKLDWNNPEGYRCPFDLTKPLPLKGHSGRLTVAAEYFFNSDLEFLKSSNQITKYTTSITKTKATRESNTEKILSVVSVKVEKLHGYGHLEEIVVRRSDRQLYKFKEGGFVDLHLNDLHLNDIEDMLLLVVQHKLFQLDDNDIVEFIVALRIFTISLIIKRPVEDVQLDVESYKKKLNLTTPQKTFHGIKFKEIYTPSFDPPG